MSRSKTRYHDAEIHGFCVLPNGKRVEVVECGTYDYSCNVHESFEGYPIISWSDSCEEFTEEEYEEFEEYVMDNATW